jgi:hypothetical protein
LLKLLLFLVPSSQEHANKDNASKNNNDGRYRAGTELTAADTVAHASDTAPAESAAKPVVVVLNLSVGIALDNVHVRIGENHGSAAPN